MKTKHKHASHSKYLIKFHIIFVVKYRKELLVEKIDSDMKQIFFEVAQQKEFVIETMETEKNHIHLLVDVKPTQSAFDIIHPLKCISTFRIYKLHKQELKKHFWKENTFWSDGYFACSTGDASTEIIRKYIEQQG